MSQCCTRSPDPRGLPQTEPIALPRSCQLQQVVVKQHLSSGSASLWDVIWKADRNSDFHWASLGGPTGLARNNPAKLLAPALLSKAPALLGDRGAGPSSREQPSRPVKDNTVCQLRQDGRREGAQPGRDESSRALIKRQASVRASVTLSLTVLELSQTGGTGSCAGLSLHTRLPLAAPFPALTGFSDVLPARETCSAHGAQAESGSRVNASRESSIMEKGRDQQIK